MLTRLEPKRGEAQRSWLLIEGRDLAADETAGIFAARPESVKSGRRIEQLVEMPACSPAPVRLRPARPPAR